MVENDKEALKHLVKDMQMTNKGPVDILNTVNIKDLDCAEISRVFALKWKQELHENWYLLDSEGKVHSVKYNMDLSCPAIIQGWFALRDFYGLIGDHIITLVHFGNSLFHITVDKNSSLRHSFPTWHSFYHQNPNSKTFRLLLTKYKVNSSSLDVPCKMYWYLKDAGFTHINFQNRVLCKIVYNHHISTAKIGSRWKQWASNYPLKPGQELTFKFPDPESNLAIMWIN